MRKLTISAALLLCLVMVSASAWAQQTIPNGTQIKVRTDEAITATSASAGKRYTGKVTEAVNDANGQLVIPQGSVAYLVVVRDGDQAALDLSQVQVRGQRYSIVSKAYKEGGIGMNKRTAKYTGGGAIAGAVLGGLMGGGKGAAIGTLVGGAAGAGAQVMTKGKNLKIPAETELTYKLANDLQLMRSGTSRKPAKHVATE